MRRKQFNAIVVGVLSFLFVAFILVEVFNVPPALFTFWRIPHRDLWFKVWLKNPDFSPDVLDYPHAKEITEGMTADKVRQLVGTPTEASDSMYGSVFVSSPKDSLESRQIKHFWYYKFFGWADPICITFGHDGRVEVVSWGHG